MAPKLISYTSCLAQLYDAVHFYGNLKVHGVSVLAGVDPLSEDNFVSNGIGNQHLNHSHWMPTVTRTKLNREKK